MEVLKDLKYTKNHEWILIDGNQATIGITDYAQNELGDIVYVDIDTLGEILDSNSIFGSVEAVKTVSDLYMPIKGRIVKINPLLQDQPELINNEPYKSGWILKIEIDNDSDSSDLLTANQYKEHIGL